ncbi:Arm DNA-binding domain-containing protein [Paenibacillus larvae]
MKGHFYKPNCKCPGKKTKKCSCGATWSYIIDVGINPKTGKRKQKKKGGFKNKQDAQEAAALLVAELSQGTYIGRKIAHLRNMPRNGSRNIRRMELSKPALLGLEKMV